MLREIAITPSLFEQGANENVEDWRDILLLLLRQFGSNQEAIPVVVSNLGNGQWLSHVCKAVFRIQDPKVKQRCMQLLTILENHLVKRSNSRQGTITEDYEWCEEAIKSSLGEPIDRIFTCEKTKCRFPNSTIPIIDFKEILSDHNYLDFPEDSSPKLDVSHQVNNLQKLLFHSDWITLVSPYGLNTEKVFTFQLVDAFAKVGNGNVQTVNLHVNSERDEADKLCSYRNEELVETWTKRMKRYEGRMQASVHFWPKLLDRYLLAGTYTEDRKEKFRWSIFLGHIARKNSSERTEWKLVSRQRANELATKYTNLGQEKPMKQEERPESYRVS